MCPSIHNIYTYFVFICFNFYYYSAYPTVMKKWQDEVLHSERFKWAFKEIGRAHYCRKEMSTTIDDKQKLYDDDDVYLVIKKDENKFAFLIPYYNFFISVVTSDLATILYIGIILFSVLYGIYYLFVNHEILRLARTKSGYSLVA